MLRAGECGKAPAPADAGGCAGEENRAAAAFDHSPRRLAAGQEPREGRHFPNFGINLCRCLDDRETHIRPDIEDEDLDRADLPLDPLDERDNVGFDARVEPERMSLAALRADRLRQLVDRLGMPRPPGDADAKAPPRESARDRGAEPVACPDHEADATSLLRLAHLPKPDLVTTAAQSIGAHTSHERSHPAENTDRRDDRANGDDQSKIPAAQPIGLRQGCDRQRHQYANDERHEKDVKHLRHDVEPDEVGGEPYNRPRAQDAGGVYAVEPNRVEWPVFERTAIAGDLANAPGQ